MTRVMGFYLHRSISNPSFVWWECNRQDLVLVHSMITDDNRTLSPAPRKRRVQAHVESNWV